MAAKFQTKITKARFVYSPLSGERMAGIGKSLIDTIFERWDRGLDVQDTPARPLTAKYARFKSYSRRKRAVRDYDLTGKLRSSIQALSANQNKVTVGPIDGMHSRLKGGGQLSFSDVLTINQRRWRMWGVSPAEKAKLVRLFAGERPVKAVESKTTETKAA
jgi:hypothetical protein